MLVDCAVCSTLLAPLVAGASRPQGSLREPCRALLETVIVQNGAEGGYGPPYCGGDLTAGILLMVLNHDSAFKS